MKTGKHKRAVLGGGFTLVELIVVIVVLAVLIGALISGIYMYIGRARTNTDLNNASAIEDTLSTINTQKDVYKWAKAKAHKDDVITIRWSKEHSNAATAEYKIVKKSELNSLGAPSETNTAMLENITEKIGLSITAYAADSDNYEFSSGEKMSDKVMQLMPQGLPSVKATGYFCFMLFANEGHPVVSCSYQNSNETIKVPDIKPSNNTEPEDEPSTPDPTPVPTPKPEDSDSEDDKILELEIGKTYVIGKKTITEYKWNKEKEEAEEITSEVSAEFVCTEKMGDRNYVMIAKTPMAIGYWPGYIANGNKDYMGKYVYKDISSFDNSDFRKTEDDYNDYSSMPEWYSTWKVTESKGGFTESDDKYSDSNPKNGLYLLPLSKFKIPGITENFLNKTRTYTKKEAEKSAYDQYWRKVTVNNDYLRSIEIITKYDGNKTEPGGFALGESSVYMGDSGTGGQVWNFMGNYSVLDESGHGVDKAEENTVGLDITCTYGEGSEQGYQTVIYPAFNIDASKLKLSGNNILEIK